MNSRMPRSDAPISNPFSTRYTCPSALGYVFSAGTDTGRLVAELRDSAWWGQIVGRHGSGKSTLLHTLVPALRREKRTVAFFALHQSGRRLRMDRSQMRAWDSRTQVVVDGYEQLAWFQRIWLRRKCRAHRAGLLVTAHRCMGLPLLWQTTTGTDLAWQIVKRLLEPCGCDCISQADVTEAYRTNRGDMRETLMALYDLFEQRTRRG
jgi:hypothetical protein